jgi:hypothetical protein
MGVIQSYTEPYHGVVEERLEPPALAVVALARGFTAAASLFVGHEGLATVFTLA